MRDPFAALFFACDWCTRTICTTSARFLLAVAAALYSAAPPTTIEVAHAA